ncbi:MAG: efflux RND transporter periplasmic adaptor subunit [gamma proteobacterium symbiont of Phacoides pectinatus]
MRTPLLLTLTLSTLLLGGCAPDGGSPPPDKGKRGPEAHLVELYDARLEASSSAHERTASLRARRMVRIHNQEEGRVTEAPYFEGDRVAAEAILVHLDDALLMAELEKARATARQAGIDLKRIQDLVRKRAASEDELARARTALEVAQAEQRLLQTRVSYTLIKAPFAGVITERAVEPGDVVSRHSHLLTLTDPDSLVTEIHVSEPLLPHLAPGDPVQVRIDALGSGGFEGRILRIHPELDPTTRQGVIEVLLEPVPEGARAGQFARVTFTTAEAERLMIPFASVRRDRSGEFVYLVDGQNRTRRTTIRTGMRIADRVEVLEGLEPGQRVVTRGFLGLSAGKEVKPVNLVGGDD